MFKPIITTILIVFCCCELHFGQTITKQVDPDWTNNSHWTGTAPEYSTNQSAIIDHNSDISGNPLNIQSGHTITINAGKTLTTDESITIEDGGTLIVNGTIVGTNAGKEIKVKKGTLTVNPGGRIDWDGYWTSNDDPATITLDGNVTVGGNFNNQVTISGDGELEVIGTLDNTGGSLFGCTDAGGACCYPPGCKVSTAHVLPIELLRFTASPKNNGIKIDWITSSEINNDYFTIEKSINGITFEEIAKIEGAGNSNNQLSYSYTDEDPFAGNSYYRLKQTDFDGKFERFKLTSVYYDPKTSEAQVNCDIKVQPNPCPGHCLVKLENCENYKGEEISFKLFDIKGNLVQQKVPIRSEDGAVSYSIDTENYLMPGVYVIDARSQKEKYNQKIIVK